jgi:uncharacterized protein (DUF2249 family)
MRENSTIKKLSINDIRTIQRHLKKTYHGSRKRHIDEHYHWRTRTKRNPSMNCTSEDLIDTHIFDARGISKRFRHAAIFGAIESLDDGESMRFINDHDPAPLLVQLQQRYGGQVIVDYVDRSGPVVINFHIRSQPQESLNSSTGEAAGSCCGSGSCGCSSGGR